MDLDNICDKVFSSDVMLKYRVDWNDFQKKKKKVGEDIRLRLILF